MPHIPVPGKVIIFRSHPVHLESSQLSTRMVGPSCSRELPVTSLKTRLRLAQHLYDAVRVTSVLAVKERKARHPCRQPLCCSGRSATEPQNTLQSICKDSVTLEGETKCVIKQRGILKLSCLPLTEGQKDGQTPSYHMLLWCYSLLTPGVCFYLHVQSVYGVTEGMGSIWRFHTAASVQLKPDHHAG